MAEVVVDCDCCAGGEEGEVKVSKNAAVETSS